MVVVVRGLMRKQPLVIEAVNYLFPFFISLFSRERYTGTRFGEALAE